jgi:hypothetical protein
MSLETLKEEVRKGKLDRPALIKALRRERTLAIERGDVEVLSTFKDTPVEVIADRIIAEVGGDRG